MDHELEALEKARNHVADIAALVATAEEHLHEGRFEEASACLRLLVEQHAAISPQALGELLRDA